MSTSEMGMFESEPIEDLSSLPTIAEGLPEQRERFEMLAERYARDTWVGLDRMSQTPTGFPSDRVELAIDGQEVMSEKTSPTNIGLFLACIVGARDLGIVESEIAADRLETILTSLEVVPKHEGLFYNWYNTATGQPITEEQSLISTVDMAWLAAGLMTVRAATPSLANRIDTLLDGMNFPLLYDGTQNLFFGGYQPDRRQPTAWHYDIFNSEPRIASYVGISRFGIPESNLRRLGWFSPANAEITKRPDRSFLPSWGGSGFENDMPTLFVPEKEWSQTLRQSHFRYVREQIQYGEENNGGFWGISPSEDPSGVYREYGLPQLAIKEGGYGADAVVTPHASFLAINSAPEEAFNNLQRLQETFPLIYRDGFGFTDSVNVQTGEVSHACLAPDQAMSFLAVCNYRSDNKLRNYFASQLPDSIRSTLSGLDNLQQSVA